MAEMNIILSEIEVKVRKLIDANHQHIEENRRLASENQALREENEALVQANQELHEKINKTTIVNALGNNEEEIKEGRKLIKELIKEIDQCVSILNTKE
jgi:soluble cytochrome b562